MSGGDSMHVRDLAGEEYILQSTINNQYELNGNRDISLTIRPSKANNEFINEIGKMWTVVDHDEVEYKIIYLKRTGKGNSQTVEIKAIPLFFDDFDNDRVYEEVTEHMTADNFFTRLFAGTGYTFEIVGSFLAVQWQGLGKGDPKLEIFKRGLDRYFMEFRLEGKKVYLEAKIGRDTDFMYRHRLNASNIVEEVDASEFWTYAKGYGDFSDDEEGGGYQEANLFREYVSPLEGILGIKRRHAPPIIDGRITNSSTMDAALKKLVDESLKVSVSATIHQLKKQGFKGVPELGDRVYLIDERIGLNAEVRIVDMNITRNWKGDILSLELTFGTPSITKRHQAKIDASRRAITELVEGKRQLPYNALDEAVRVATEALRSAQTQLIFDNGIIAQDKSDPNRMVLFNSEGIGISDNGGIDFTEAITADGFVLSAGVIGRLGANHIQIGPDTDFQSNYDPSSKETPQGAQNKASEAEANAKKHADDEYKGTKETVSQKSGIWDRASVFDADGNLDTDYLRGAIDVNANSITQSSYFYWDQDGLVAVEPSNPNKIVKLTSGGIGISIDGGATFQTAMTADGVVGIDIIGTNIMSFNTATNDVITMESGRIEAFDGPNMTFKLDARGLEAYSHQSGDIVGALRPSFRGDVYAGLGLFMYGDYLSIGKVVDTNEEGYDIVDTQFELFWREDNYDYVQLSGSSRKNNEGRIELYGSSRYLGETKPKIVIDDFNGTSAEWRRVGVFVGNDKVPVNNDDRTGFEVWQYRGTNDGASSQLFKIDTDTDGLKYIGAYVDKIDIPGRMLISGTLKSRNLRLTNGNPTYDDSSERVELYYDSSNISTKLITKDASGNWWARIEVEGRGENGLDAITHIRDRVRSVGTRFNEVTWSARVAMGVNTYQMGYVSSSKRFKLAIEDVKVDPYNLLKINPKSWYDKNNTETYADSLTRKTLGEDVEVEVEKIKRIGGLIAEEVEEAGLELYLDYSDEGEVQGVDYDRIWTLLIPIVREQQERIETLENTIKELA